MQKIVKINSCYQQCPFFDTSRDGMMCNHHYWNDKGAYANFIITHENSRDGNIPEECPLRTAPSVVVYILD